MPRGETGVLVHCDLAHFNVVSTILTEDVGMEIGNNNSGFLLLGRADGEEAKGVERIEVGAYPKEKMQHPLALRVQTLQQFQAHDCQPRQCIRKDFEKG